MANHKVCKKCGKDLPLTSFYKHSGMKDGHLNMCINCYNERVARYRKANANKIKLKEKDKGRTPRKKRQRLNNTRKNREEKGYANIHALVERSIATGEIKKPNICEVCGRKPTHLEAHHVDYDFPLVVVFLCPACHRQYHVGRTTRADVVRQKVKQIFRFKGGVLK